ncbi:class I SAM-dependent methyltransferase [Chloroflexi bacterium]|nr:class I SAM-dependent methyltransferase [Chloroflexota bacterium]
MRSQGLENRCSLCLSYQVKLQFVSTRKNLDRRYLTCDFCGLVFVPTCYHLSFNAQRERYLEHNNSPSDPGYREFLSKLKDQITPHLNPGGSGLDYGSGPGPTLSKLLESEGFEMEVFDPIFDNHPEVLEKSYDFIVTTETVEHFVNPNQDFQTLNDLVRPGGWIGVMTSILYENIEFDDWYYRLDPTHVSFYRPSTMEFIGQKWNLKTSSPSDNIYLFQKKQDSC